MNHNEFKAQLFKEDPAFFKKYQAMTEEYQFIEKIIRLRIENNLTQHQLAKKIGTTQSIISKMESGNYNPSYDFLKRLAAGFGKKLQIQFK